MEKNIQYWFAILLAIFFGFCGLQEFYTQHLRRGILAVLFWWTLIPELVAFIEICVWLYKGESWFNSKYNPENYANKYNVTTTLND